MVHQCESLALGLEPGDYFPSVHSGLDYFQSDAATHGLLLLSQPNFTHATFAYLLQKVIPTNNPACGFAYLERAGCCKFGLVQRVAG